MGTLSELTLGEIGRGLARYRPVALTVGAILVAIAVMPKADVGLADLASPIPGSNPAATATVETVPDAALQPAAATSDATTFDDSFTSPSPTISSPSFAAPASSPSDSDSFFSPTTTIADEEFTFAPTTSSDQPLRIRASAWATRTAGTPLAAEGVPKDSLPVGTRAGQDDKLSFVRLSGDESILRLSEDTTGRASVQGPVAVQACQITVAGWKEGEAIAIADAPASDAGACVEGARSLEGVWLFDLGGFSTRADDRGFALRPGKGAGIDFQVAFRLS